MIEPRQPAQENSYLTGAKPGGIALGLTQPDSLSFQQDIPRIENRPQAGLNNGRIRKRRLESIL